MSLSLTLVALSEYEKKVESILPSAHHHYFTHGTAMATSLRNNLESFKRLRLRPRCLRDVSTIDMSCSVLGLDLKMPIGIAPSAFHELAHPDGEKATARAAEKFGSVFTQSCLSNCTMREVAEAAPNAVKWAQFYIFQSIHLTEYIVKQAEENGYKALVLTVDSPVYGSLSTGNRINLQPNNPDVFMAGMVEATGYTGPRPIPLNATLTWQDVKAFVELSKLPVIAKGILRPEDAVSAIEAGCAAVWVSNHGGRQLDTTPAPIEVLPEITMAVKGRVPILIDSGFRYGIDVFKALALGADMVFIGRPIFWGLALKGQEGAEDILNILKNELELAMEHCGVSHIKGITSDLVVHEDLL